MEPASTLDVALLAFAFAVALLGFALLHVFVLLWSGMKSLWQRSRSQAEPPPAIEPPGLTVTYLVSVYNDGLTVGATIDSLLRQSRRPDRILVVNDGSTDDTAAVLDAYRPRGVDVLHLPKNVGKTRAIETALKTVDTDIVAITDADSVVHEDYLRELLPCFADPQVAAAAGTIESIPHTWVTAARQVEYVTSFQLVRRAESKMGAMFVLVGSATAYRTKILKEMGFEHDTIAEDLDLTFRMHAAGHKQAMNPRAKVYVSDPPTLKDYHRQLHRWYTDFWIVARKHRKLLGKRVFGKVEFPGIVANETFVSALYLAAPLGLLFVNPHTAMMWFGLGLAADTLLVAGTCIVYRRGDVWWAMLSRTPMRFIARFTFLYAMVRVLANRPGMAWQKLERRSVDAFAASKRTA